MATDFITFFPIVIGELYMYQGNLIMLLWWKSIVFWQNYLYRFDIEWDLYNKILRDKKEMFVLLL